MENLTIRQLYEWGEKCGALDTPLFIYVTNDFGGGGVHVPLQVIDLGLTLHMPCYLEKYAYEGAFAEVWGM